MAKDADSTTLSENNSGKTSGKRCKSLTDKQRKRDFLIDEIGSELDHARIACLSLAQFTQGQFMAHNDALEKNRRYVYRLFESIIENQQQLRGLLPEEAPPQDQPA